jgi:membrane glycosyltransferase
MLFRRALFLLLLLLCCAVPLWLLWQALGVGGFTVWEGAIVALVAVIAPWIGTLAASSLIGFVLLLRARDPLPLVWRKPAGGAIFLRTALVLTVRNEDLAGSLAAQRKLLDGLDAEKFHFWVLSDTQDSALAAAEEEAFAAFRLADPNPVRLHYRRRAENTGYKAGNVMDFVRHEGREYDAMLTLDADSVMAPRTVLRLVRLMQAEPDCALVQTLIAARPTASVFPRLFQFGMRHGMRSYATGIAWWQGQDGPYWGHNALLRLAAFRAHGAMPTLPNGARILSHDQVEAAMLRAAGWQVRLDPNEDGSWEGNPPDMLSFLARDTRWMAGNLQYFALLRLPIFRAMGRVQLALAILLFLMSPILALVMLLGLVNAFDPAGAVDAGLGLLATWLLALLYWSPKLLGSLEVAIDPARRAHWGGGCRLARGVALECVFDLLLLPIRAVSHSGAMLGLLLGRKVGWAPQQREAARLRWAVAARALWWHTLVGAALLVGFALAGGMALAWAAPFLLGPLLSMPFAVLTTEPRLARRYVHHGTAAVPEEFRPHDPFPPLQP